jgi:hypothetical protein
MKTDNSWIVLRRVAIIALTVATIANIGMHYIEKNQAVVPPKEYILHTISDEGTPFYVHMDWDEYGRWSSTRYVKILTSSFNE